MQERQTPYENRLDDPAEIERRERLQSLVAETQAHLRSWHDAKTRFGTHETEISRAYHDRARSNFDEIVRQTHADTFTLARRLTGDEDLAMDVTQEAYLRAWRGLPKFRGDSQFTTWMYRITANTAYNHLEKKNKHRYTPIDKEDIMVDMADHHPASDVEGRGENAILSRDISKALEGLAAPLRAVVVLHDIYDLDHRAISKELGISETNSKVRLHRARKRLKNDLYDKTEE